MQMEFFLYDIRGDKIPETVPFYSRGYAIATLTASELNVHHSMMTSASGGEAKVYRVKGGMFQVCDRVCDHVCDCVCDHPGDHPGDSP
jgi:hypothetical protein